MTGANGRDLVKIFTLENFTKFERLLKMAFYETETSKTEKLKDKIIRISKDFKPSGLYSDNTFFYYL